MANQLETPFEIDRREAFTSGLILGGGAVALLLFLGRRQPTAVAGVGAAPGCCPPHETRDVQRDDTTHFMSRLSINRTA